MCCYMYIRIKFTTLLSYTVGGVQQPANASSYTEVIIEQLLSPVLEACLSLPPRAQSGLAALCLSVVLLELRKVILDTERVYR